MVPILTKPPEIEYKAQLATPIDVLGLGAVAVDDVLSVQDYPPADTKVDVLEATRHCGGLTATALVAASRLGARCAYAGVLGTDELSAFAASRMEVEGIDLSACRRVATARVFHSCIVVSRSAGTRNIFSNGRGVIGAATDWPPSEWIQSARVLFVDHVGIPGMLRAARIARLAGVPVVGDLERKSGPQFDELLPLVDHFIASLGFARALTGAPDGAEAARRLVAAGRPVAVVTAGALGCWYLSNTPGDTVHHQPAYPVDVVDTTGCGDVFHGAYAAALSRGLGLNDRVRVATAAAALKATQPGGQAGAPTLEVLDSFLSKSGGRTSGLSPGAANPCKP